MSFGKAIVVKIDGDCFHLATSRGVVIDRFWTDLQLQVGNVVERSEDGSRLKLACGIPGLKTVLYTPTDTLRFSQVVKGVFAFKRRGHTVVTTDFFEEVLDVSSMLDGLRVNEIVGITLRVEIVNGEYVVTYLSKGASERRLLGFAYSNSDSKNRVHVVGYPDDFMVRDTKSDWFLGRYIHFWSRDGKTDKKKRGETKVATLTEIGDLPAILDRGDFFEMTLPCYPINRTVRIRSEIAALVEDRFNVLAHPDMPRDVSQLHFRLVPGDSGQTIFVVSPDQPLLSLSVREAVEEAPRSHQSYPERRNERLQQTQRTGESTRENYYDWSDYEPRSTHHGNFSMTTHDRPARDIPPEWDRFQSPMNKEPSRGGFAQAFQRRE